MAQTPRDTPDTRQLGKAFIWAAWLVLLALLTWFFSGVLDHQRNPNQSLQTRIDAGGIREVVLQRNRFGHYVTSGSINGEAVTDMDAEPVPRFRPAGLVA